MSPRQLFIILVRRSLVIVITFLATLAGAGTLLYVLPARYDAVATATIDPAQSDPVTGQTAISGTMRVMQGNLVALAKSTRVALEVVKRLNLATNPNYLAQYRASDSFGRMGINEWIAAELLAGLDAKFTEGSDVLYITAKSANAIQSAQVANTFMSAFTDTAIEMKVAGAQQTAQWFEPQTERLRQQVEEARLKMNRFQAIARLAPTGHGDIDMTILQQLSTDIGNIKSEMVKIRSSFAQAETVAAADQSVLPLDSALMQSLKTTLANTAAEIGRVQSTVGTNNPKLQSLLASQKSLQVQIASERQEVRGNLDTRLKSLQSQLEALEKARSEQLANVVKIQEQRDQLAILARDVELSQERYISAAKAAAAARLQGQLSFSNITVLDRAATPINPAFPKTKLVIPAAIAAGLGLGAILALIVEALNRRVRVPRDLDFASLAPSLGMMISAPVSRKDHRSHRLALVHARM